MSKCRSLLMTPKPFDDESLAGYILRLTEANFYEKISDIYLLSNLWEILKGRSKNGNLLNPLNDNMQKLSELINCSLDDLVELTFASNDTNSPFFQYRNQPIPRQAIHTTKTKICPKCLAETAYYRKAWDLVPVSACLKHQTILIDRCPKCGMELSWSRSKVLECLCGQLLSEIPSKDITIMESPISILFSKSSKKYLGQMHQNPLINLNLFDLFEVLVFFSWFLSKNEKWKLRNKYIGKSLSNQEIHQLFSNVYKIFSNWPINFIKFVDDIQESALKLEDDSSIENSFGYFYTALYKHLDTENTKFIIDEFDEYLANRWDGGYIAILRKASSKSLNKKYLSASDVWKLYGIPVETVKKYVNKGIFKGFIKKRGNTSLILVEKISVEKYKQRIEDTFSTKETSKFLDVFDRRLHELRKYEFIKAIRGPKIDGYHSYRYSKESVYELLEEILKKVPSNALYLNKNNLITFRIALKIAGNLKSGLGQLVKGILENDIKPMRLGKGEGLNQLGFLRDEVRNYFLKLSTEEDNKYATIREMVKITGVKRENIADWMKKGFLVYEVGETNEFKSTKQEFKRFLKTYVPLSVVAKQLNTNSKSLYQKLLNNNIVALSGPRVDGGNQYLYLKEEIDNYIVQVEGTELTIRKMYNLVNNDNYFDPIKQEY
ncbi:TniQ family protein [Neobacillus terrae]|uniref:TniQ family protein n=1 Tax=Neobacillus terrae TaxID=3034837 RepID=UPI00140BE7A0|nr:TniQ family protein [Neobacillus terrae]NHM29931.1 TniQ family protein [Neobacillus terrae]